MAGNKQNKNKPDFNAIADIGTEELHKRIKTICAAADNDETDQTKQLAGIDHQTFSEWREAEDQYLLERSYLFSEGVDFDLTFHPLQHLGYKVGVASVSDILSRNGIPKRLAVNIAVPNKISVEHLEQLITGLARFCTDHNITFSTVDVTASQQILIISTSVSGSASRSDLNSISNASPDDAICITGDIGGAMAGLRILLREKKYWQEHSDQGFQPNLTEYEYVVQKQLLPAARYEFTETLRSHSVKPSAMLPASNGLIHGLAKICTFSDTGFYIYQATLPIALPTRQVADEMGTDVDKYALYGGEDFEMIFTMPEEMVESLNEHFNDYTIIGKMTDDTGEYCMQNAEGDVIRLEK